MSTLRSIPRAAHRIRVPLRVILSALGSLSLLLVLLSTLSPLQAQEEDAPPVLSISDLTVSETVGTAYITVSLNISRETIVIGTYETEEGSATKVLTQGTSAYPGDFISSEGEFTIMAGELITTIPIMIENDEIYEANEQFTVSIESALDIEIIKSTGVITITNDDNLALYLPHAANQPQPTWRQITGNDIAFTGVAFNSFDADDVQLYMSSQTNDPSVNGIYRTAVEAGCVFNQPVGHLVQNTRVLDIVFETDVAVAGTFQSKAMYYSSLSDMWFTTESDINPNVYSVAYGGLGFYAGTDAGVYKSINGGSGWTLVADPVEINVISPRNDTLWIGTFQNGVAQLQLSDDSFQGVVNTGLPINARQVWDFAFYEETVFVATADGVYFREGESDWQQFGGLAGTVIYSLEVLGNTLYAGTENAGVWSTPVSDPSRWASVTDGNNTDENNTGIESLRVLDLVQGPSAVCSNQLFAATDDGIWVYGIDLSTPDESQ